MIRYLLLLSCHNEKSLERRITALERRVATLEQEPSGNVSKSNTETEQQVQMAGIKSAENPASPVISFDRGDFDFGRVNEGEVIEHTFRFMNYGQAPLVINKATASCGCTVPTWPKEPIPAGGSGEIRVRFDTKGRPNQQIKTVTIEANTIPPLTKLQLKGYVIPKTQVSGPVKK
jgi:hypothetical protein